MEFSTGPRDQVQTDLFDEHRTVRFARPKGEGSYKFDPARSEMSQSQIKSLFTWSESKMGTLDPPPAVVLSFARASLLRLARSGDTAQKQWLTNYLSAAPASAIKSELTHALAAR